MPRSLQTALVLLLIIVTFTSEPRAADGTAPEENKLKETRVRMSASSRELAAAVTKARETLPEFWAMYEKPEAGVSDFAVKLAVMAPKSRMKEYIWITNLKREAEGKITGEINTSPGHVKAVKLGQKLTFEEADIADWMFTRNGKIVGNWTLRPMMNHMPMGEADLYRSMLETP